jgi:hypothetical protein
MVTVKKIEANGTRILFSFIFVSLGALIFPVFAFADALLYEGPGGHDVSKAVYAGVSEEFDVSGQEGNASGIVFNDEGTKMFIVGSSDDAVVEYALSAPYDVSTATYSGAPEEFDISGQETSPSGIAFNTDGTKMFIVGDDDAVVEYALSGAFDVSTASYSGIGEEFDISGQETSPSGIAFNTDGTKMFIVGYNSDSIVEYSLTAFDVSTATYSGAPEELDISGEFTAPRDLKFDDAGTTMLVIGSLDDSVAEYSLSVAFDVSTATYAGTFEELYIGDRETTPTGIAFDRGGSKLFVVGNIGDAVVEYTIDPGDYSELGSNIGTISSTTSLSMTLVGDTFQDTDADNVLDIGVEVTIANVPTGLTSVMTLSSSDTVATLTFTGSAPYHTYAFNVSDFTFIFDDTAFTGGDASAVTNSGDASAYSSNVGIIFKGSGEVESVPIAITYDISVSNPIVGEEFSTGDEVLIAWTTGGNGVTNFVDLSYSLDGVAYVDIATNVDARTGSYAWKVPSDIASDSVRVRAEGTDLLNPTSEAIVDSISINAPVVEAPVDIPDENPLAIWSNTYVTSPLTSSVYYIDEDLLRHPFIDAQTYFTWQDSFDTILSIEDDVLGQLELGSPMVPNHDTVLVKIQSENKVYAVTFGGGLDAILRWIPTEELAVDMYGVDWADYVIDVPVTLFSQFQFGADISTSGDIPVNMSTMKRRVDL